MDAHLQVPMQIKQERKSSQEKVAAGQEVKTELEENQNYIRRYEKWIRSTIQNENNENYADINERRTRRI